MNRQVWTDLVADHRLAECLRRLRNTAPYVHLRKAARDLGIGPMELSKYEAGHLKPPPVFLGRVSLYYGLDDDQTIES